MTTRKKILMIPGYDLYPVYFGGAYGQTVYLDRQQYQHELTLIISSDNIRPEHLSSFKNRFPEIELITTDGYGQKKQGKKLAGIFPRKKKEFQVSGYFDGIEKNLVLLYKCREDVVRLLTNLFEKRTFDLVQVEHIINLGLVNLIPEKTKKIYIHPELFYQRMSQEIRALGHDDSYTRYLSEIIRTTELELLNRYDAVLTVSDEDKQTLETEGLMKPVFCSTSPLYPADAKKGNDPQQAPVFLFMGSENHYPNRHGLEWFFREVYPLIREKWTFKLMITGWWSESFKKKYSLPGCRFTGFVENLDTLMQQAVLLNPVYLGSGLRMKVIVSMGHGVPVISTSPGAKGIRGLVNKENILLADDPEAFARAIESIEQDPTLRHHLSEAGYSLVRNEYDQESNNSIRNQLYEQLFKVT
ncbi:MAG: glycosyltransferase family 4 protein [Chitinophagaceae bacterium]|nr:glycosyltransferase family 4 protein [Chitinophagaceae bacterium]